MRGSDLALSLGTTLKSAFEALSVPEIAVMQYVNYAIQNGCGLSRARILRFKHNDVADLERVLEQVAVEDAKKKCAPCCGGGVQHAWAACSEMLSCAD